MKLQAKLTFALLLVSLLSVGIVGVVAYSLLMEDFRQSAKEQAFKNYQEDLQAYLGKYGSLEAGQQQEPFDHFARTRKESFPENFSPLGGPKPFNALRPGRPPFRFLTLDPQGKVISYSSEYPIGTLVPKAVLKLARPVNIDGELKLQVVQIGEPILTENDLSYLRVMRKTLLLGMAAAGGISLLLGLIFGRRLSGSLRLLTQAVHKVRFDGELPEEVKINSRDEIAELAEAFNTMNSKLLQSHETIQTQAEKLRELSVRDPLTGLFNRRYFDQQAEIAYCHAVRYQHSLTVMIGDLDHFKQINDNFSHAVGDEVLRRVAQLLQSGIRKSDLVARYGGEEFVLLFPETGLDEARQICDKLRRAIDEHNWPEVDPKLKVTMSMGLCNDLSLQNMEKMMSAADNCLYLAKDAGRNRIVSA